MRWQFLQNRTYPIGIDVGVTNVRMLQLRHGRAGWHVIAASIADYSEPLPDDDVERKENLIADAVRRAKSAAPFEGTDCVSCLSTSDMLLRAARLPKMTDAELDKAASWEASDRFNFDLNELETIWIRAGQVTQGNDTRDEVILVSVPTRQIASHLDALIANHLRPIAVDASFAAITRSTCRTLRRKSDLATVQMIINVGTEVSSVILTRGNQLAFLKTIPVGGYMFDSAVALALSMSEQEAIDFRSRRMLPPRDDDQPTDRRVDRLIFESVRPHMHDLAQEAALCLRYYSVTFRGQRPEVVKITGTNAAEPNLSQVLADHLKIPTEVARPFDGIDISKTSLGSERRDACLADWSTALGLSLRGRDGTLMGGKSKRPAERIEDSGERQEAA